MDLFDWMKNRWTAPAAQYTYVHIDPSHVDLGDGRHQVETAVSAGEHYFRLWLVAMSLRNDREWFTEWNPAAYSVVRFRFGDKEETVSHIAGQTLLQGLDPGSMGRRVALNYPLTALAPFNGGEVEIETGLLGIKGRNDIAALLNVLGRFSRLLVVPQLSAVLSTAAVLAEGLAEFLGATESKPVLRFHNTFTGGDDAGSNRLRSGYFLLASAREGEIDPAQLWVTRDRPFYGASKDNAPPLAGCDYMLFRIEATDHRDDWESLTTIQQPYQESLQLLQQAAYEADPDLQKRLIASAEQRLQSAKIAAIRAPELTRVGGRNQVIDGLLRAFQQAKAALGQGAAETPLPTTLSAAVRRAMPVGQAISLGEVPDTELIVADRPLPTPVGAPAPAPRGVPIARSRGAAVGAAPPAGDIVVKRTPHMDVPPAPLRPGQQFSVRVFADQLVARPGEDVQGIEVSVPAATKRLDLEVWIAGTSHFEFPGARTAAFAIDLTQPDAVPSAEFQVKVRTDIAEAATGRLTANFTCEGRASGHVSAAVAIAVEGALTAAPAAAEAPAAAPTLRVDVASQKPDLTIEITDPDATRQHLHCRVWSPHVPASDIGEPFTWNLDRSTGDLVKAYMSEFVKPDDDAAGRLLSLKGAGRQLWDATPKRLKDAFWKIVDLDRLETILIVSEEPFIPWELMVPHRGPTTLQPLGVQFTVGRWLPSDFLAPAQQLSLSRSIVVAPAYPGPRPKPLKHSASEAQLVLEAVPGEQVQPAQLASIRTKLAAASASLVHFVCHGAESETFGIQVIELESGQLTSLQLTGMDDLQPAFQGRPLVFLNACEIGRLSTALVGVGGFAKAFIDLGAGAVVAPLWSVKDSIAHEIAEEFYGRLEKGPVHVAELFKEIRKRAYAAATAGEDTYAAYCFYGDPDAVATTKE